MPNNQIKLIKKMYEYNLWANTGLIEICAGLSDEQLQVEAEGVYGRIHPTLVHLIRAEGAYVKRASGTRPWAENVEWEDVPMSVLLERAQLSGNQLISISGEVDPATPHVVEEEGGPFHFFSWTVLLQALYHAIEHRTQIKFLLTQLGVEHPDFDAWDYVESLTSE